MALSKNKKIRSADTDIWAVNEDLESLLGSLKQAERTASSLGFYLVQHFIGVAVLAVEERRRERNEKAH